MPGQGFLGARVVVATGACVASAFIASALLGVAAAAVVGVVLEISTGVTWPLSGVNARHPALAGFDEAQASAELTKMRRYWPRLAVGLGAMAICLAVTGALLFPTSFGARVVVCALSLIGVQSIIGGLNSR